MTDVLKTLESWRDPRKLKAFLRAFSRYYFTLGRGRPKTDPQRLWFTHRGRILGYFELEMIERNAGQFPPLRTLDGELDTWQIKPDRWVAICRPPFHRLAEKIYHTGFRG